MPAYRKALKLSREMCSHQQIEVCNLVESREKDLWREEKVPPPEIVDRTMVTGVRTNTTQGLVRIQMEVVGPTYITLLASPLQGAEIINATEMEETDFRIEFTRGGTHRNNRLALLVKKAEGMEEGAVIMVSVSGHYLSGQDMRDPVLEEFLIQHPDWVTTKAYTVHSKQYYF